MNPFISCSSRCVDFMNKHHLIVLLLALVCRTAYADEDPGISFTDEQLVFFETNIRPVLAQNCYSCHSHEAERNRGGFYLDSRRGFIEDRIAEPGNVEHSLLLEAVRYNEPGMQMPPSGKLPNEVIADLERWVEMGMPWPEGPGPESGEVFDLEQRRADHWAWTGPELADELPQVDGRDAATSNVIDLFIEARLAEEGINPGPKTDRATLIRRVTLDLTGLPPTHLDLLDHLAVLFMEKDGWSNKAMIRRIVLSDAYQRTSDQTDPVAEEGDPSDTLLHRQRLRRMTAETIRDSILFVAGSLNEEMHGRPVNVHLTPFMEGRGRPGRGGPLDGNGRRSIYISVRRNFLPPMMLVFDMPTPSTTFGRRNVSNAPAQALTLMNDPFVHDQANRWAQRLIQDSSETVEQRIDVMFIAALGRPATDEERVASAAFINSHPDIQVDRVMTQQQPWRDLCHVLFNVKGFIYIR